jgi:hypothetical protein
MKSRSRFKMWAVMRDGEIYLIRPTKTLAKREITYLSAGSKHEWGLMMVRVTKWQC